MIKYLLGLVLITSSITTTFCQEEEKISEKKNRVSFVIGHSFIPEGINENGSRSTLVLAAWGLDYDRYLSEKWGIGLHTDFVVSNYSVENIFDEEDIVLKRTRPFTFCLISSYKFNKHFSMQIGAGEELAKEENFFLIRLGAEIAWELSENWEFGITLTNDLRPEAYNTTTLGFAIGRLF